MAIETDAPTPADPALTNALQRIHPDLSLELLETDHGKRWAVLYRQQDTGTFDYQRDQLARRLHDIALQNGYEFAYEDCAFLCDRSLKERQVVCYVTEDDGSYRVPDGRIIEKVQRMDYYRHNLGLQDWRQFMNRKADLLRDQQRRDSDHIWSSIARDVRFREILGDILYGKGEATRSIIVPGNLQLH